MVRLPQAIGSILFAAPQSPARRGAQRESTHNLFNYSYIELLSSGKILVFSDLHRLPRRETIAF
jgi:hypothetical protein